MIPFLDLAKVNQRQADDLAAAARRVIDGGWYVLGQEVTAFEKEFAAYCGVKHCVGVGNGLDALVLILRAAIIRGEMKPGDEVLVPANTYVATVLAVMQAQLTPVLVEAAAETFNITAAAAARAADAGGRVRAVLAVHLYGRLAPMQELRSLCRLRGWLLFEDAAQAHGAADNAARAGALGDAAGFSFYPGKNFGALGDSGAITTDDDNLAEIVTALRNYGSLRKYENQYQGINSRLDEMQAALLRVKLSLLDDDNRRRRAIAARYLKEMKNPQIRLPTAATPAESHVWHLFVVRCRRRQSLMTHLRAHGVGSLIHYPIPPHRQQAFNGTVLADGDHPEADAMAAEVLSLPLSPVLDDDDVTAVVRAVNAFA